MQTSVQAAREPLRDKLASVVSAREKDVATMRARTTPWKSFFQDEDESNVLGSGKIARVPGAGLGGEDSDGLARIERWVEDVVSTVSSASAGSDIEQDIYLNSEIIRLKAALSSKSRRKTVMGGSELTQSMHDTDRGSHQHNPLRRALAHCHWGGEPKMGIAGISDYPRSVRTRISRCLAMEAEKSSGPCRRADSSSYHTVSSMYRPLYSDALKEGPSCKLRPRTEAE